MEHLLSFVIGLLGSLVASVIFLYYILTKLRPRIDISPYIAYFKDLNVPDSKRYYFKIVNKSSHAAFDVRFRICELIRWPAANGKMHEQRKDLEVRKEYLSHVPKYKKIRDGDTFAPHAIIITCLDDRKPILEDTNKCIELQVLLRHGLTGLSKVFHYEYSNINSVKEGIFDFGNQLTITV